MIEWPNLTWRRRRYKLLLMWRLLHGEGPPKLFKSIPSLFSSCASYSFRNRTAISFPFCSTAHRLKSILPSLILLWNSQPSFITEATTFSLFLSKLDVHFSADGFPSDSLNDFLILGFSTSHLLPKESLYIGLSLYGNPFLTYD